MYIIVKVFSIFMIYKCEIMKVVLSLCFVALGFMSYSQSGLYIVTEKYDGLIGFVPSFDSVFVTTPTGVTTKYKIPHYITNPSGHNSQLSTILNGITSQGYKVIELGGHGSISVNNTLMGGNYIFTMSTIFLGKP